jgi:hypothetical protein
LIRFSGIVSVPVRAPKLIFTADFLIKNAPGG